MRSGGPHLAARHFKHLRNFSGKAPPLPATDLYRGRRVRGRSAAWQHCEKGAISQAAPANQLWKLPPKMGVPFAIPQSFCGRSREMNNSSSLSGSLLLKRMATPSNSILPPASDSSPLYSGRRLRNSSGEARFLVIVCKNVRVALVRYWA